MLAPAGLGALAITVPYSITVPTLVVGACLAITIARPMAGWLLVVLAYPFIYLQLFLGATVNIPYVDAFALLTSIAVGIRLLATWRRTWTWPRIGPLPGLLPCLAFLAVGALSLTNLPEVGDAGG